MNTNGTATVPAQASEGVIVDTLQEEVSVGYKPQIPLEALWSGNTDMPQITFRRDLEFMQMHPVVISAIEYYKSGIAGAEFWGGPDQGGPSKSTPSTPSPGQPGQPPQQPMPSADAGGEQGAGKPISMDERVSQFVLAHVERFWQRGVPIMQEGGYPYGWAPGEHIYKESGGMLVWSHVKGFHPNDAFILTLNHQGVGIRVKNIREPIGGRPPEEYANAANQSKRRAGEVDLWFASGHIPAKAAWYPHRPRFNQYYGRSQLIGAWRPWRRLGWRDAVEQVIDAAIYRAGYKGPVVRHPMQDSQTALQGVTGTKLDGRGQPRMSARDYARQIVEFAKAGAGFTLSSEQYTPAQGGGNKWDIEWPDHVMDVRPLIEAARYYEDQIMLGIGVPPELVKAGGTGSGYSGRSIPREAFLDQQQRVADALLQMFVEQVVRPLVIWNFGDIPFNIQCKPLLKTQTENKQGQPTPPLPQPAAEGAGGAGGAGAAGGQPDSFRRSQAMKDSWAKRKGSESQAMSIDSLSGPERKRVLEIVTRVLHKRSA